MNAFVHSDDIQYYSIQVRSEGLEKHIKFLVESLEDSVHRRETLVDKAETLSAIQRGKRPQLKKSLTNKRVDDLSNKLKKLAKDEKDLSKVLQKVTEKDQVKTGFIL